mmetsp:Transcript_39616/g.95738  ORF Transcript_39616/g.95738 Transcript_39616/m.95738 type:complete len:82 (+) Transcript_39616:234-479(+)
MNLFKEMTEHGIPLGDNGTKVHCKVFEDNSGALEIAKVHKFRPRTKHLNNRLLTTSDHMSVMDRNRSPSTRSTQRTNQRTC